MDTYRTSYNGHGVLSKCSSLVSGDNYDVGHCFAGIQGSDKDTFSGHLFRGNNEHEGYCRNGRPSGTSTTTASLVAAWMIKVWVEAMRQ